MGQALKSLGLIVAYYLAPSGIPWVLGLSPSSKVALKIHQYQYLQLGRVRGMPTLAAIEKGKDGIRLVRAVDARHRLRTNSLRVERLGLRKTCCMLNIGVNGSVAPILVALVTVVVVVVSIELWGVLSLLDLAGRDDPEHGDLNLAGGLGWLVVGVVVGQGVAVV